MRKRENLKGLDEAAEKHTYDHFCPGADFTPEYIKHRMEYAFKAGAEWERQQGWTFEAHKGSFGICFDRNIDYLLDSLEHDEKVIVQIRKK